MPGRIRRRIFFAEVGVLRAVTDNNFCLRMTGEPLSARGSSTALGILGTSENLARIDSQSHWKWME